MEYRVTVTTEDTKVLEKITINTEVDYDPEKEEPKSNFYLLEESDGSYKPLNAEDYESIAEIVFSAIEKDCKSRKI